jgi:hypothetical protein
MTMTSDGVQKLRGHVATLRVHKTTLDEDAAQGHVQILEGQFRIVQSAIADCERDFPGVIPPFETVRFRSGPLEGVYLYDVAALRSYLATALAKLETLAGDPPPGSSETKRGFISHVSTDYLLADYLRAALEAGASGVTYFMASQRGHIQSGDPWCQTILNELKRADRFLILLTPASIKRLWVSFETGAAWMSGVPRVLVAVGGLESKGLPTPLSELQVLFLDGSRGRDAVVQMFEQLGSQPPDDLDHFVAGLSEFVRAGAQAAADEGGWQGVQVGPRFYAWDGPLEELKDWEPVKIALLLPEELKKALDEAGAMASWQSRELDSGQRQLFITDKVTYKRAIVSADQRLVVRPTR